MKAKIVGLLAVGLLAAPMAAKADVVTWEAHGTISIVSGSAPSFASAQVGDQFSVTWSFDTDADLLISHTGGIYSPGQRDDYSAASLLMTVTVGANLPVTFSYSPTSPASSSFNRIISRNDSGDQPVNGNPADGISFGLLYTDFSTVGLIFRTDDLTVVTEPGLPANPYPGMAGFPLSAFQYTGDTWGVIGDVTSVSRVPAEPVCDGATGHCYEYVPIGLYWDDARIDAFSRTYAGMPGHLVTITTSAEQAFIETNFPSQKGWMGGFQPSSDAVENDPAAAWQWVTGEALTTAQWGCGQPDDFRSGGFPEGEDYMEMKFDPCLGVSQWNDAPGFFPNAYFVEYEPVTDLMDSLGDQVAGLPAVNDGQRNVMSRLLENATRNVESGSDAEAIDKLLSFINYVNAQRGKSIATADADRLIQAAQVIINGILLG